MKVRVYSSFGVSVVTRFLNANSLGAFLVTSQ